MAGRGNAVFPLTAPLPTEMTMGHWIIREIVMKTDTCLVRCERGKDPKGTLACPLRCKGGHGE